MDSKRNRCCICGEGFPVDDCARCAGTGSEPDADGYLRLGVIARELCGMQSQYASRYLTGLGPTQLGDGLRVDLSGYAHGGDYHAIRVHAGDAVELARRINTHRRETGQIA